MRKQKSRNGEDDHRTTRKRKIKPHDTVLWLKEEISNSTMFKKEEERLLVKERRNQ